MNPIVIWNFQQGAPEMTHTCDIRKRSAISILKILGATVLFAVARVTSFVHPCC